MMVRGFSGIKTHFGFILREGVEGLIMWPMIPMLANEARLMLIGFRLATTHWLTTRVFLLVEDRLALCEDTCVNPLLLSIQEHLCHFCSWLLFP